MTPDRARTLERVRKLLALAESPNEHEARSAALLAVRTIAKNGFEIVDKKAAPPAFPDFFNVDRPDRATGPDFATYSAFDTFPSDAFQRMREAMDAALRNVRPPERRSTPKVPPRPALVRRALGRDEIRTCRTCDRRVTDGGIWFSLPSFDARGWCEHCGPRNGP